MTQLERIVIAFSGINYCANNLHQIAFLHGKSESEILKATSEDIQQALKKCADTLTVEINDLVDLMNGRDILCEETIAILNPIVEQLNEATESMVFEKPEICLTGNITYKQGQDITLDIPEGKNAAIKQIDGKLQVRFVDEVEKEVKDA